MTDRLPYEELLADKLSDLSLPDINAAWKDMERRLEEEDDDKPLLPPWWKGCAGWALLGVLVLGMAWILLRPEKWFTGKKKTSEEKNSQTQATTSAGTSMQKDRNTVYPVNNSSAKNNDTSALVNTTDPGKNNSNTVTSITPPAATQTASTGFNTNQSRNKPAKLAGQTGEQTGIKTGNGNKSKRKSNQPAGNKAENNTGETIIAAKPQSTDSIQQKVVVKDSAALVAFTNTVADTGSSQLTGKDSTRNKVKPGEEKTTTKSVKSDSSQRSRLELSTGVGLQQQIPLAGQKFAPYNSLGRNGTWRDYIPSVYIRLTKPGKWFLQAGFRYGAPQINKEFIFRQQIINDTGTVPQFSRITSGKLQKTFYHQLPLTFNYYVLPGFSIGAGVQMNRFVSAIYENELVLRDNFLQRDSVISKFTATTKGDSSGEFKKTYWQAVIESQYQWKRFSFGARYTFGLEPYIQFSLPGSGTTSYRNRSLEVFIRYELWKTKRRNQ